MFSLYSHPHIKAIPYLYANCSGMPTQNQWKEVYDHFKNGILDLKETYKNICSRSGRILKLVQVENVNIRLESPNELIAENIVTMIKENNNYIVFSVLINCNVQTAGGNNRNIVMVLLRSGIANKDCLAEGSEQMSITFQIMERQEKGFILLNQNYELLESNLYETIQTILEKRHLELTRIESIELIMMHKKAVECVQSYLDNSDSNVCGEILSRIETSVDNLMSVRM